MERTDDAGQVDAEELEVEAELVAQGFSTFDVPPFDADGNPIWRQSDTDPE